LRRHRLFAPLVLLAVSSCAGRAPAIHAPVPPASAPQFTLFLIGDAGEPEREREPVLEALTAEIREGPAPSAVVFLGDNIYPKGMPHAEADNRTEMDRRLKDQMDVVLATNAKGIFVPGNHDWAKQRAGGWSAVKRQERFIREHGNDGQVELLPRGGCPGPEVVDLGQRLRLITLDTQWWLHSAEKPGEEECDPGTEEEILASLGRALAEAGDRYAIVVAHHPLLSSGSHGGHFTWRDHLFPLTAMKGFLWVPLPVIGSLYPVARMLGISNQDQSGSGNKRMRAAFDKVFREYPPLMHAAGHEHTLEVLALEDRGVKYQIVSGSGIYGHVTATKWRDVTLYKAAKSGFIRLDVTSDGRLRLGVHLVDASAHVDEIYSMFLEP